MLEISGLTWAVTIGVIVALLALDLALAALRPHRVGFKEATAWSVFYIAVALAFGAWMWWPHGSEFGTEYLAGYIVEKSLSVDNLFVFVIIMTTFAVPEEHQHKVLTFGIVLALIMRAIFIALGATLLSLFSFMFLIFGLLLIFTAVQLFRHRDEDPDIEDNVVVKGAREAPAGHRRVRRRQAGHPRRRAQDGHPADDRAGRDRRHRPAVRPRLDPRGLRRHAGGLHRLRGERLRAARPAGAVLPRQGPAGPAGLPLDGARR